MFAETTMDLTQISWIEVKHTFMISKLHTDKLVLHYLSHSLWEGEALSITPTFTLKSLNSTKIHPQNMLIKLELPLNCFDVPWQVILRVTQLSHFYLTSSISRPGKFTVIWKQVAHIVQETAGHSKSLGDTANLAVNQEVIIPMTCRPTSCDQREATTTTT